jgi:hypothetical protein
VFMRRCFRTVLAVASGLALSTAAQARGLVVLIVPMHVVSPPVPQPPPPTPFVWVLPLPAEQPRVPPPSPRCYAGDRVCALERSDTLGGTCVCRTADGSITGRALIPPSRRFGIKG